MDSISHRRAIFWLGSIRRRMRKLLAEPPFSGKEVSAEDYCRWDDRLQNFAEISPGRYIAFFRVRHTEVHRYNVPQKHISLFQEVEEIFDLIAGAADLHKRLRESSWDSTSFFADAIDGLACDCMRIGVLVAQINRTLGHRVASCPSRGSVFDDRRIRGLAEDEIRKQLRSRRDARPWTAATDAAATALAAANLNVTGRYLRKVFGHLNPNQQNGN